MRQTPEERKAAKAAWARKYRADQKRAAEKLKAEHSRLKKILEAKYGIR